MAEKRFFISAEVLFDGKLKQTDKTIVVEGETIVDVSDKKYKAAAAGIVTPAFIDAHSHIGMERQGEPVAETETNDSHTSFAGLNDPVNSIYFDDRAFSEAVDFGVLYSCVVPGSGNILGGKAVVIRNFVQNRTSAVISDYGYKMALGYNPRSTSEWKGPRANTRMGTASLLESYFSEIIRKEERARITKEKALLNIKREREASSLSADETDRMKVLIEREYEIALTSEQWAIFRFLNGEKTAKVHVHKEDDALFLIDLKKKFNINVTAEHCGDIFHTEVFNELAANDIPVIYGPLGSFDYKVELKNASYKNVAKLMASQVEFGLMSDHPVTMSHNLRDSLKYFLIYGMAPHEAVSRITHKNASILGIEDKLGSVEPGKYASLIVWDKDPFYLGAFPIMVLAEGNIIRERRGSFS